MKPLNYIEERKKVYTDLTLDEQMLKCDLPIDVKSFNKKELLNLDKFKQAKIFGIDLETFSSLSWGALSPFYGWIRLISISLEDNTNILIDLGGWLDDRDSIFYELTEFFAVLKEKLADLNTIKVGMNLKFDIGFLLYHYGLHTRNVRDLMLCSQVLWAGVGVFKAGKGENRAERGSLSHSLKGIAQRLESDFNVVYDIDKSEQASNWGWHLSISQIEYARKDSLCLIDMYEKFKVSVKNANLLYSVHSECLAVPALAEMEVYGFPVDLNAVNNLIESYKSLQNEILEPFHIEFPEVLWTSSDQVLEAFNNKYFSNRKKQLESVSKGSLQKYLEKYPAMTAIIEARNLAISIKYLEKIRDTAWDSNARTMYSQNVGSGSGRMSCTGKIKGNEIAIQIQNSPKLSPKYSDKLKPVREVFKAPEGYKLLVHDFSQMHNRIACELSQDPILLKVYRENLDAHIMMARQIATSSGKNWSEKDIEELIKNYKKGDTSLDCSLANNYRNLGKIGNYSGLNQSGANTLVTGLEAKGTLISLADAEIIIKSYKNLYKVLIRFIKSSIEKARLPNYYFKQYLDRHGRTINVPHGVIRGLTNRRHFLAKTPSIYKDGDLDVAYTDSIANLWLGSEADMLKESTGLILLEFDKNPHWDARLVASVHDETVAIGKEEYALEASISMGQIIEKVMKRWIQTIPISDNFDYSKNIVTSWSEK